jgi:hypothetical protein
MGAAALTVAPGSAFASALGIVIWVLVWILCVSDLIGVNVGVIFHLRVASIPDRTEMDSGVGLVLHPYMI